MACTATENGKRLEVSDKEILLSRQQKTKALKSLGVAQLICVFVFHMCTKTRYSHEAVRQLFH